MALLKLQGWTSPVSQDETTMKQGLADIPPLVDFVNSTFKKRCSGTIRPFIFFMSGTFSQIYIQTVFTIKKREHLLHREWRQNVFKYISTIIKEQGQKPIIVNGVGDHVHAFFGLKPTMCVSDLMRHVKANSSNFISREYYPNGKFEWQEGYGAFSYSHSQLDAVYKYILNQEVHHQKKTFREEYLNFLEKFNVTVDERNLFEFFD